MKIQRSIYVESLIQALKAVPISVEDRLYLLRELDIPREWNRLDDRADPIYAPTKEAAVEAATLRLQAWREDDPQTAPKEWTLTCVVTGESVTVR